MADAGAAQVLTAPGAGSVHKDAAASALKESQRFASRVALLPPGGLSFGSTLRAQLGLVHTQSIKQAEASKQVHQKRQGVRRRGRAVADTVVREAQRRPIPDFVAWLLQQLRTIGESSEDNKAAATTEPTASPNVTPSSPR